MSIQLTIIRGAKKSDVEFDTDPSDWEKANADITCGEDIKVSNATFHHPEEWDTCEDEIDYWQVEYSGEGEWNLYGSHGDENWDHEVARTITSAQLRVILKEATKL